MLIVCAENIDPFSWMEIDILTDSSVVKTSYEEKSDSCELLVPPSLSHIENKRLNDVCADMFPSNLQLEIP